MEENRYTPEEAIFEAQKIQSKVGQRGEKADYDLAQLEIEKENKKDPIKSELTEKEKFTTEAQEKIKCSDLAAQIDQLTGILRKRETENLSSLVSEDIIGQFSEFKEALQNLINEQSTSINQLIELFSELSEITKEMIKVPSLKGKQVIENIDSLKNLSMALAHFKDSIRSIALEIGEIKVSQNEPDALKLPQILKEIVLSIENKLNQTNAMIRILNSYLDN